MKSPPSSDCQQNKLAWDWPDKTLGVINVDEYVVLVLKELIMSEGLRFKKPYSTDLGVPYFDTWRAIVSHCC